MLLYHWPNTKNGMGLVSFKEIEQAHQVGQFAAQFDFAFITLQQNQTAPQTAAYAGVMRKKYEA